MATLMLYEQLTQYLKQQLTKAYATKLYSWIDKGTLINQGRNITQTSIEIGHIRYSATILLEDFPYRKFSAVFVMALIQLWLNEHDSMRDILDLYEVNFDIDITDDNVADITFDVEFQEPITAIKSLNGVLDVEGEKYNLSPVNLNYISA